jgi:hypothetical protein
MQYNLNSGFEIYWVKGFYEEYATQQQFTSYPRDVYNIQAKAETQLFGINVALSSGLTAGNVYLAGRVNFDKAFTPISSTERIVVLLTPFGGNSVLYSARPYAIDNRGFTLYLYCHKSFSVSSIDINGMAYRAGYLGQIGLSV